MPGLFRGRYHFYPSINNNEAVSSKLNINLATLTV